MARHEIPEIKEMLKGRIRELCRELLPDGRPRARLWFSHNPNVAGDERKKPALSVAIDGDRGAWRDWRNGDKGDVIDLIVFAKRTDRNGALKWARDWLGLEHMTAAERLAMKQSAEAQAKKHAREQEKRRLDKLERAADLFNRAWSMGQGGPVEAHAKAYFTARNCGLEDVQTLNGETFRFSQATEWWNGAKWRNENGRRWKEAPGPEFPAIHSGMRMATGIVTACHITFLDPALPKKAPVDPPKLMYGEALGAVIEVACGGSSLVPFWHPAAAEDPGPVILAEGIETALSLAIAIPEARVWACGSIAGLGHAPVQLPCVSDITLARDNNTGNAQALRQLSAAIERLEQADKPLVVINSHVGDDFNDLSQGEE